MHFGAILVRNHYDDVIMTAIASHITSLTIVYSIVYSDTDQRKHQSSASLAFARGIHRDRWIPRTNGQLRGKCFHLMTSSCKDTLIHCERVAYWQFTNYSVENVLNKWFVITEWDAQYWHWKSSAYEMSAFIKALLHYTSMRLTLLLTHNALIKVLLKCY